MLEATEVSQTMGQSGERFGRSMRENIASGEALFQQACIQPVVERIAGD